MSSEAYLHSGRDVRDETTALSRLGVEDLRKPLRLYAGMTHWFYNEACLLRVGKHTSEPVASGDSFGISSGRETGSDEGLNIVAGTCAIDSSVDDGRALIGGGLLEG